MDNLEAPFIHTLPKSTYNASSHDKAIKEALTAAIGIDAILPVIHGGKVIGLTKGYFGKLYADFVPLTHKQWCGFSSYKDLITAMSSGKRLHGLLKKADPATTSKWLDLWPIGDIPKAGGYLGSALTARQFDDTTVGALNMHFTPGGTKTKHLARMYFTQTRGTAIGPMLLYDRVLSYEVEIITTVTKTMINTLPALRYISSGLPGLMIMPTITDLALSSPGATASNLTTLTYVDNAGNTGQTIPTDTALAWSVSGPSVATATVAAAIVCPYTTAAAYSPFLPLAPGDTGIRSITDYTSSAINTGTVAFICVRPIAWITITDVNNIHELDFGRNIMTLERVYDGACLSMLMRNSAASCGANTVMEFVWS